MKLDDKHLFLTIFHGKLTNTVQLAGILEDIAIIAVVSLNSPLYPLQDDPPSYKLAYKPH